MTSKSPTPSTDHAVSSQLGRKWLESSDNRVVTDSPADQQPARNFVSKEIQPGVLGMDQLSRDESGVKNPARPSELAPFSIAIPDVSANTGSPVSMLDYAVFNNPEEMAHALAIASEDRLNAVGGTGSSTLNSKSRKGGTGRPNSTPLRNDISEPPTEWTDMPSTRETQRNDLDKPSDQATKNLAIEKLTNAIVEKFPLGDPTVLLFVGSESNRHIDETCARVASELADRKIGRILLLDSDAGSHELSNASGVSGQPGITDVVNDSVPWESTIYGRSATGLDFLASGKGVFHHPDSSNRLRRAVAEMKKEYQFICIAAGDAQDPSARIWNDICDGSYLLVSMKNSNQTIAKSAVAEMQSSGARLLGCVVTDVD